MSITGNLIAWAQAAFAGWGPLGLFAVAFMESSFFPIPPDLLLIPMALAMPELALFYALIATIGSVLGSVFGYYIGVKGGRPILRKFASERSIDKVDNYFKKYGNAAIAIAAFSPIPYKIFTIAAGVFRHRLHSLILVSIPFRGARFFMSAAIIMLWGKDIIAFFDSGFDVFTLAIAAVAVVIYVVYRKLKKRKKPIIQIAKA
ncbi:MAG: YqaA family protein, partial [Candidatus Aenigmatarchaeota archaeon]